MERLVRGEIWAAVRNHAEYVSLASALKREGYLDESFDVTKPFFINKHFVRYANRTLLVIHPRKTKEPIVGYCDLKPLPMRVSSDTSNLFWQGGVRCFLRDKRDLDDFMFLAKRHNRFYTYSVDCPVYVSVPSKGYQIEFWSKADGYPVTTVRDLLHAEMDAEKTQAAESKPKGGLTITSDGNAHTVTATLRVEGNSKFGFIAEARCHPDDQYNFLTGAMLTLIRLSSPATAARALDLYYHSTDEANKVKPIVGGI